MFDSMFDPRLIRISCLFSMCPAPCQADGLLRGALGVSGALCGPRARTAGLQEDLMVFHGALEGVEM